MPNDFKNKYLDLFSICRDYSIGPGSEKSPSFYGLYSKVYDNKLQKYIVKCKGNNL
ncbi:hypothetical protein II654_01290 [bacterium]|nr:hypothetical protein [bacterium]